jgi:uncharacterized phage-associated protein
MVPVSALDVAAHILDRLGPMSAWKLQKLVYYCQAWSLVWDGEPLFRERVKAWDNGPVVPQLYHEHRGQYDVVPGGIRGDSNCLDGAQRETVEAVLAHYGGKTGWWLADLTHAETPWVEARARGEAQGDPSPEITHESMLRYYGGLLEEPQVVPEI